MKKDDIKNIAKLIKEKKYDEIYIQYGSKVYLMIVPNEHMRKDVEKLLKEQRYFDLYEKYGESVYNSHINEIQKQDIENQLGVDIGFINYLFFDNLNRKLKTVKKAAIGVGIGVATFSITVVSSLSASATQVINENTALYEEEINEYNKEIEEYAEYINSLGLSDLEIIIKVMNDMWSNIDGYKNPTCDILGYHRLSIYNDGYGVCRNMADDFTARMNAINPDYEACNLYVYIENAEVNEIDRNIIVTNDTVSNENDNSTDEFITNVIGNHMVSCIKLKDEDIILIVDPTNPSIGVLKNGQITMLSNKVSDGIDIKPIGSIVMGENTTKDCLEKIKESFFTSGNIDKLKEKYGIQSQNKTLEQIIKNYSTDEYEIKR